MMARLLCLGLIVSWSCGLLADEREAARRAGEARQELVELVDSLAADAPERAEKAYAVAVSGGKGDLRPSYALALIRTRHGAYKGAAEVLDSLPNADKRQPAVMRLWLALELGENAKADRIFQTVTSHLGDRSIRNPERLEAAKTLVLLVTQFRRAMQLATKANQPRLKLAGMVEDLQSIHGRTRLAGGKACWSLRAVLARLHRKASA